MAFYLLSWILLVVCGAAVGSAILAVTRSSIFSHYGDHLIAATWLGLLTIGAALLGLSVVSPLSPGISFGLGAVLTAVALSAKAVREDFRRLLSCLTGPVVLSLGVLAVIAALNATRLVEAYDTGLYHYPLTRWLSRYGTIRGLALIHFRFGFSSSWFALAAPFDFGPFQGRIGALLGGLATFLCLSHLALVGSRIFQRRADRADWFLAGGYAFVLFVCFSWAFEVSLSPDVPVWILTLLVGWLMMVGGRPELDSKSHTAWGQGPLVALIVALGTIALKPSAAPIVAIAGIFYLFTSSAQWTIRLVSVTTAGLLAVPMVAANVTSSGCPLYPNAAMCLDVPWGVGKDAAKVISTDIGDWGRYRNAAAPAGAGAGSWLSSWISQPDKLVLMLFCGTCLLGFAAARGWRGNKSLLYVLGLALGGTAFLLATAPNPRFGTGYFSLYPALLLSALGPGLGRLRGQSGDVRGFHRSAALAYALVTIAALVAVEGGAKELRLRREERTSNLQMPAEFSLSHRLLLPPALASSQGDLVLIKNRRLDRFSHLDLAEESSNGIEYRCPKDRDQCWGADLPCVPAPFEGDVHLRLPANGLRSGFIRAAEPGNISRR